MPFAKSSLRFLFVLALAAVLAGCFGGGGGGGGGGAAPMVYLAGYRYDGTKAIPCLWTVTGTGIARTDLNHPFSGSESGYATSVFVVGATVYVGGYYYDTNNKAYPCYWTISGGLTGQTIFGSTNSYVESIHVYGNTVYTAGWYWDGPNYFPRCWRGTTDQNPTLMDLPLPQGATRGEALSVFGADENTSYAAGWYYDGSKDWPCYWISYWSTGANDRKDLPAPGGYGGKASSVFVSGNTVYTAGWYYTGGMTGVPCYWVNQANPTALSLPTGAAYGYANSISVSGGTVHTAGYCGPGPIPCYWTGASPTALPLPAGVTEGWAESVAVAGGVVYTAGYYVDASGNDIPCYWRGTARTDLPLGGAVSGRGEAIFVR